MKAFDQLTNEINAQMKEKGRPEMTMENVALGFIQAKKIIKMNKLRVKIIKNWKIKVANEAMCRPIRRLTEVKYKNIIQIWLFI